jgi:hypothetical protein
MTGPTPIVSRPNLILIFDPIYARQSQQLFTGVLLFTQPP